MVAAIEPEWVLHINPDLLKHQYYEPRWQPAQGGWSPGVAARCSASR
jgi:hypothetical protein